MPAIHIGFMAGPFYEQGFRTLRTQDRCLLFTGTSKKHGISSTDKMTCRLMVRAAGQTRFFFQTPLLRRRTAACKSAAEPPLQKTWHFPLQNKFLPGLANIRGRGDKSFRIRVQRVYNAFRGACSTISPAYMTIISSHMKEMTCRLCEINR